MRDDFLQDDSCHSMDSALGKKTVYDQTYNPRRLYPISRAPKRKTIGVDITALPFYGYDEWNHYEVSWLNLKGKPIVATAVIRYDCCSPFIVESKSLKLYFNSLNQTAFESVSKLEAIIQHDLEQVIGASVSVTIHPLGSRQSLLIQTHFSGELIDDLDIECTCYTVDPSYLVTSEACVDESLCSNLLKSNCLVTNQPDWGSVQINYRGHQIDREGLLRYLVSYRNHNEFHEQCIERIFMDIMSRCQPQELTVYGRYTRRGGLDINPYRSTQPLDSLVPECRLMRQ